MANVRFLAAQALGRTVGDLIERPFNDCVVFADPRQIADETRDGFGCRASDMTDDFSTLRLVQTEAAMAFVDQIDIAVAIHHRPPRDFRVVTGVSPDEDDTVPPGDDTVDVYAFHGTGYGSPSDLVEVWICRR